MTNKEIVDMLKLLKEQAVKSCNDTAIIDVKKVSFDFVIDSAITALSQEQQSEWERDHEILKAYDDGQESMKPCKDAISRQSVKKEFAEWHKGGYENCAFYKYLDKMPPVSIAEKVGTWKKIQSGDKKFPESIVCSRCGYENSYINEWSFNNEPLSKVFRTSKYCPNCGAKMEVEE